MKGDGWQEHLSNNIVFSGSGMSGLNTEATGKEAFMKTIYQFPQSNENGKNQTVD